MKSSTHLIALPGLSNVGIIVDGKIYRGAQPEDEGYRTLWELGVRTLINFRTTHGVDEVAAEEGISIINFPFTVLRMPSVKIVTAILTAMGAWTNQAVYIKCQHGQDRTGYIAAAYRVRMQGWSVEEAWEELESYVCSPVGEFWPAIKQAVEEL